jgi:hypothetical protein
MTTIELGPNVRLQKVGDFNRAGKDPEMKPPIAITSKFPAKAENFKCGPEGTWYATVEELVLVKEGTTAVKRPRDRIHWLSKASELRVATELPVFHEVAFDDEVALLTADRGELLQMSLESGTISALPLEGQTFSEEARLYEIFLLQDDRVVIHESDNLILAKRTKKGLEQRTVFPFEGAFTVLNSRYLVGGTDGVQLLDLATDSPREIASTTQIGVGTIWRIGEKVRTYSSEDGAWEIVAT